MCRRKESGQTNKNKNYAKMREREEITEDRSKRKRRESKREEGEHKSEVGGGARQKREHRAESML